MTLWMITRAVAGRIVVLAVAVGLAAWGATTVRSAETDVLPEISPPYVEVQTEALGLSAEEVEQLITAPMENLLLNGVAFLDDIRSESVNGLSSITLIFEPGTDLLEARQVVQERLTQAGLLAHLTDPPAMVQPLSSANRVLAVGFRSTEVSAIDMSVLARWTIRPRLLGVPGVANVSIFGQRERQLQVQVDPRMLARHRVTLQEVINTSGNALWVSPLSYLQASAPGTGGFVDTPTSRLEIRHVSPITSPRHLSRVALEREDPTAAGPRLTLGDVAQVRTDHQPLIGDAVVDDGPGLVMVVEKFPGANTVEVTRDVEAALDALAPGMRGITVDTGLFRPATFVEAGEKNYVLAMGAGLLAALLLVLLVLLRIRAAVVAAVAVAVSLLTTVLVLDLLGTELHALALAGLALAAAVMVHDAASDVEHLVRRFSGQARTGQVRVVEHLMWEARRPAAPATAVVLVAVVPLLVVGPLEQAFYRPAVLSFAAALVVSLIVSATVTPALASLLLRSTRPRRSPAAALRAAAERVARRTAGAWRPAAALLGAGLVATVAATFLVDVTDRPGHFPELRESDLVVSWRGEPGISREAMTRIAGELGSELRRIPGVESVGGHVGRAVLSDRVNGIDAGELWVGVTPGEGHEDAVAAVREIAASYTKAPVEVRSYYADRVEAGGALMAEYDRGRVTVRDNEVAVRVYGEELPLLLDQAALIEERLAGVDGVAAIRVETPPEEPNLEVAVDLEAAERHGLKPGDVRRVATTLATGLRVGSLFEEQKVFDVVVNGTRDYFADPELVGDLLIDKPDGTTVPLREVADVEQGTSFSVINRESVSRRLDLVITVEGDRAGVGADIKAALAGLTFPLEYHAEVIGDNGLERGPRTVALVSLVAFLTALLLLQVVVRSWRVTAAAIGTVVTSMLGALVVALLLEREMSVGAVLGCAAVLAIAVRNVLALVSGWGQARRDGEAFGPGLVTRGVAERGAGILLSGGAAALTVVPVVLLGSRPGLEVVHPLAVVVLGGVVTATLVPLLLLPPLYLRLGERVEPDLLDDEVVAGAAAGGVR